MEVLEALHILQSFTNNNWSWQDGTEGPFPFPVVGLLEGLRRGSALLRSLRSWSHAGTVLSSCEPVFFYGNNYMYTGIMSIRRHSHSHKSKQSKP